MIIFVAIVLPITLGTLAEKYLSTQDVKILSEISKPEKPVIRNAESCAEFCSRYKEAEYRVNGSPDFLIARFKEKLQNHNWKNLKVFMSPNRDFNSQISGSQDMIVYSLFIRVSIKNSYESGKSDVSIQLSHY